MSTKPESIGAYGPVDGMDYSHPDGGYVHISVQWPESVHNFQISRGQAELLIAEITGVLKVGKR